METGERWRLGHRPALDGLRGVAVLLVVACHTFPALISAGPVGVTVFFVLSGFLITALLLQEWERTGGVDFRAFYLRRARRLLPALAVFLVVMFGLGIATGGDVLRAVFYVANFNPAVNSSHIGHTWSLSVEEQFYLVFPVAAWLLLRWRGPRALLIAAATGAIASGALRLVEYAPDRLAHIYYGTETNAGAMLAGAALAVLMTGRIIERGPSWLLVPIMATFGLLGLLGEGVAARVFAPMLAAVLAVAALRVAATTSGGWLTSRWLVLAGKRSYGIYLWHFPLVTVVAPALGGGWVMRVALLGASVALAELSWRFVERPIMQAKRVAAAPIRPTIPAPAL